MVATIKCDTIKEATSLVDNLVLDGSGNVTIGNNLTVTGTTTQTGAASFTGQLLTSAGTAGAPAIARSGDADNGIFFPATNTMAIATAGTEDMRFTPEGNVTLNSATFSPTTPGAAGNMAMTGTLAMGSSFLRNRIINGATSIHQRGVNLTTNNSSGYSVDRFWGFSGSGTAATQSQISSISLSGFTNALRVQRDSGNTGTNLISAGQIIETRNCFDLAGQTVTLSFYARAGSNFSSASSVLSAVLRTGTAADQGLTALISGWTGVANQTVNVTLTTSWQLFTATYTVGSSVQEISPYFAFTPVGTAGANDYFDLTGVQLELGSVATPFERRQYGTELMLCQRYFTSTTPVGTAAITATGGFWTMIETSEINRVLAPFMFPVAMRASPTMTAFSPNNAATGNWYNRSTAANVTVSSLGANSFGITFNTLTNNQTAGNQILVGYTASAEL
jgi:hypothetical protein